MYDFNLDDSKEVAVEFSVGECVTVVFSMNDDYDLVWSCDELQAQNAVSFDNSFINEENPLTDNVVIENDLEELINTFDSLRQTVKYVSELLKDEATMEVIKNHLLKRFDW